MRLPSNPTLTWLLSFWCMLHVMLVLVVVVPVALVGPTALWAALLAALGGLAALGLLRPDAALVAYRHWNRLAARYASFAYACVVRVSFIVVTSASLSGRTARWPQPVPRGSSWQQRGTSGIETYRRTFGARFVPAWLARYAAWSASSGHLWSLCLTPYVLLLRAAEPKQDHGGMPEKLYTLY